MMDPEQQDILLGFVDEGREMLDEVEPLLIDLETSALEEGEIDPEMVNTVFRLFHSLKGGAGFLDLTTISEVTHEAETLLDLFRKGQGKLESSYIDLMNRSCDFLRKLLEQVETEFHDHGFDEEAETIKQELRSAIESITGDAEAKPAGKKSTEESSGEESAEEPRADTGDESAESADAEAAEKEPAPDMSLEALQLTITPEMVKQFTTEAEEQLEKAEEALLNLEKAPDDGEHIQQAFRAFHSFKGNSGFLGYKDMEKLSHAAENVLDKVREGELKPTDKLLNLLLEILDFLKNALGALNDGRPPAIPALPGLLSLLEDYSGGVAKAPSPVAKKKEEPAPEEKPASADEDAGDTDAEAKPEPKKEPAEGKKTPAPKASDPSKAAANIRKASQRQSVRVDVEKLDVLLDLVGELVIAEAMVAQNPDIKGLNTSLDRFEKSVMQLEKITRDLQDIATSIRMIPLSGTFRRTVRLVRDLSQKSGKKVDFNIEGEETEVDKTVIEQINDPLIHIIRNSIDHGLETPEEREKAGKDPVGSLTLGASYVGGEVWITIKDDGRGLNRERILKRAVERGLVEGNPDEIPDEQVWPLIFQPGFSTAEKVTDVSGRGVGMDVVKRNIENIRGKVDIRTTPGKGTTVILRIPLTLAIIDGMLVSVGEETFTLPITAIRESMQVQKKHITKSMDGQEILRVRDSLIPVVRLHELLDVETKVTDLENGIVTILENEDKQICLFVDELLGQHQIVIKGLSDYVGNHPAVSGCTILGDGEISLILDVAGIIRQAQDRGAELGQKARDAQHRSAGDNGGTPSVSEMKKKAEEATSE